MSILFTQSEPRIQAPISKTPFNQWTLPDESVWTLFYRYDQHILLRFPDLADFDITADGISVCCWPTPDTSDHTVHHLYLNQVQPLVLSMQGKLMLHASAVEIDNCAVVFMGKSGQGKSTLAADFASHGFRFLTDDGLLLEKSATAYIVQPSHPSIRLWHDSQTALISERTRRAPPVQFTNKARLLAGESIAFCAEPTPLSRVYFLGNDNVTGPVFNRLKPAEALVELLKNSFLLDIDMRERLVEHFDQLTHLVSEPIFFHLNFPRRYTMLDQVRHAIVAHARNQE